MSERIRSGVGGWTYKPWRNNFFPKGLPHSKELHHASRQLSAIEVNGTFYSTIKPATFAKWHDETPDDFVFSLKAHRFATHRKALSTAGEAVQRFVHSGIAELGAKLGPIVWQLMPTARFDPLELEGFLQLLPTQVDGVRLDHVIDARHPSFVTPEYIALLRRYKCATVHTDSDEIPAIADPQCGLAYLRLMRTRADCATGYAPAAIAAWVEGARKWVQRSPEHRVFAYFISGAKERAPAAALEFLRQLRS